MPTPERRVFPAALKIETRSGDAEAPKGRRMTGHAATFDQWTTLYEGRYFTWREVIRPGAFTNALAEKQDVRALLNHDPNYILGRTKSGTLTLSQDGTGLLTDIDLPATETVNDLVCSPCERGDMDGMSFAFSVRSSPTVTRTKLPNNGYVVDDGGQRVTVRYEGDMEIEEREVLDADLYDVSPVTYPAYDGTDCSVRSVQGVEERAKERDRPHKRPAPVRESYRAWLNGTGYVAAPHAGLRSAP